MVQVVMAGNGVGQPLGHPLLHPIYQACAEHGLPIAIHAFGAAGMMPPCSASGEPSYYIEYHTHGLQGMMTTITSFVTHGVFDRFPDLKLVLLEAGVAWVPGFLWRFDNAYRRLRIETPWVKRAPSEYFHEHVRLSTQPLDSPADTRELISALEAYGGEDLLMFASDYPHWDADDVDYVAARLPREWHAKVFHDNAAQLYSWTGPEAARVPGTSRGPCRVIDIGSPSDFAEGTVTVTQVGKHQIGVIRWGGTLYAVRNVCPHQSGPVCSGQLLPLLTAPQAGTAGLDA